MIVVDLFRHRLAVLVTVLVGGVVGSQLAPTSNGDVTCLLRLHADQACPGCGMTRATGRFLNGDVVGAFAYHPWVFALMLQVAGFAIWRTFFGRSANAHRQLVYWVWALPANVVFLVGVWVLRIATGHLDNVY